MQDDPIAGSPDGDPPPRHRHQLKRWLLLELVSYPPADGDDLEYLTRALKEQRPARRGRRRRLGQRRPGRARRGPGARQHCGVAIRRAMAGPRMTSCPGVRPASDEEQAEQAVLALLLEVHPALLSVDEVLRELTDRPDDFAPRDRVNNAVRDLAAAGSSIATEHSCLPPAPRCASKN